MEETVKILIMLCVVLCAGMSARHYGPDLSKKRYGYTEIWRAYWALTYIGRAGATADGNTEKEALENLREEVNEMFGITFDECLCNDKYSIWTEYIGVDGVVHSNKKYFWELLNNK